VVPIILDVTQPPQIEAALGQVSQTVGNAGLWALINNADIVVPGPFEYVSSVD
jgi:hypothetical protein